MRVGTSIFHQSVRLPSEGEISASFTPIFKSVARRIIHSRLADFMSPMIRQPSAWIPIAMSLIVLAMFFIGFAMFGVPHREADEGTAAHLFQIWLALEVLMIAFFATKWVPRAPKHLSVYTSHILVAGVLRVAVSGNRGRRIMPDALKMRSALCPSARACSAALSVPQTKN